VLTTLQRSMAAWPRETRDTLFLLAVLAALALLLSPFVPWWCSLLSVAVLAGRAWLALASRALPGLAWRLGLLLLAVLATWASHRTLLGRDAGVTLIVVLLALKTLELRARRDAFVVFFLGFFTLLSHFTHTQSLLATAGALAVLWGLMTALINAHLPVGRPSLWLPARLAVMQMLLGAPLMLALFLFFPRVAPLWGLPSDGFTGRSGLSEQMEVGQIARLVLDDGIALRVRFEGPPPSQSQLYFRGPVLSRYDGRRWLPDPEAQRGRAEVEGLGPPVRYELTQEPSQRPWLLLLEAASEVSGPQVTAARMTAELQWLAPGPLSDLVRLRATSHLEFRQGQRTPRLALQRYLELPSGFNPRTLQLAQDLRRGLASASVEPGAQAATLVQQALERLRTGGYRYTLSPGTFGTHVADEFWFDTRAGFCEHIASSFVVLMRALDIPARVVTGYQGGELNPIDGYWVVRQRDAHAWTEVWLPQRGWVRVDPTAAVAPARVGALERLQQTPGLIADAVMQVSPTLAIRWRQAWDAVNNRWNQWVLNYTQGRQLDLLRSIGFAAPDWTDLGLVLAGLLLAATLAGWAWTRTDAPRRDPWMKWLQRARRRLRAAGLDVPPQATPRQLAQLVAEHDRQLEPTQAFDPRLGDWLLQLERQRYDPRFLPDLKALRRLWQGLHWPARPGKGRGISGLL
jgi:protein-glutamine gamma-glutamyltransferase